MPNKINDIVVEFGSARYQHLLDRYILDREAIPRHQLIQAWREVGDVIWNAPVYEQFFRSYRYGIGHQEKLAIPNMYH